MKKINIVIIVVFVAICSVSCKKTYTCVCKEDSFYFHDYQNQATRIEDIKARGKNEARKSCIAKNSEDLDDDGTGQTTICDLLN